MSSIFNETLEFTQEIGEKVELVVNGDEFYARYETVDGYTAVYDQSMGRFCFAELVDGALVSSKIHLDRKPPNRIRRHLRDSSRQRNQRFERRFELMQPPPKPVLPFDTIATFGPNNGLLNGRRVSQGRVRGLVILVEFSDFKVNVSNQEVSDMLNAEGYNANGNHCSVKDYFSKMSGGLLDYTNEVVGPITLPKHRQYYATNPLFKTVLDEVAASGIDLSQFDSLGEGVLDAVSFMYAGRTLYQDWLWPHNHVLNWNYRNYQTKFYQISSLGDDASTMSIGTFAHESGHMLCRFPDLYDYGNRDGDFEKSAGLGRFCMMSSGNHLDRGKTPAPICAYLRDLAGWCRRKKVNGGGSFQARHSNYGEVHIFETDKLNEYFLIENRSKIGLDTYLPSDGLAVYHCDTLGSNEWQGGTADEHYQCGLLQADGHLDLENNANVGDTGDLFNSIQGHFLGHNTAPASLLWDGSESGLIMKNASEAGESISFETQ